MAEELQEKKDLFINALTTFCLFHGVGFGCKIILI